MRRTLVSVGTVVCTVALLAACDGLTEPGHVGGVELAAAHTGIDGANATSINGGGHIRDGDWDISFAGQVDESGGDWVIQFHDVSVAAIDGGTFEATGLSEINFFDNDTDTCDAAMNMTLTGTFNGEPGWSVVFRAGDAGHTTSNDLEDTARVELSNTVGTEVYDTHDVDFTDESDCVGSARTALDAGNLKIK